MAVTEIKRENIIKVPVNDACEIAFSGTLATDGATIECFKDMNTVILIKNTDTSAVNVEFEKGDGPFAVADKTVSVGAGKTFAVRIEGGKYRKDDGKIKIIPSVASKISVAVIEHK